MMKAIRKKKGQINLLNTISAALKSNTFKHEYSAERPSKDTNNMMVRRGDRCIETTGDNKVYIFTTCTKGYSPGSDWIEVG